MLCRRLGFITLQRRRLAGTPQGARPVEIGWWKCFLRIVGMRWKQGRFGCPEKVHTRGHDRDVVVRRWLREKGTDPGSTERRASSDETGRCFRRFVVRGAIPRTNGLNALRNGVNAFGYFSGGEHGEEVEEWSVGTIQNTTAAEVGFQ